VGWISPAGQGFVIEWQRGLAELSLVAEVQEDGSLRVKELSCACPDSPLGCWAARLSGTMNRE